MPVQLSLTAQVARQSGFTRIVLPPSCGSILRTILSPTLLHSHAPAPQHLRALALNALRTTQLSTLDITLAKDQGFIIADASGVPGYNPLNPGQRDTAAILARDPDQIIGE
jgi:hypothetical protein